MRKLTRQWPLLSVTITILFALALPAFASQLVLDNFQTSDISSWTAPVSPPFYTRVTWTTDGNGGSGALQIQEGGEGLVAHTNSALARKIFSSPQDWSAYQTLQFDAKIDSGSRNGYSIRIKNDGVYTWIHGFSPDTTGYQTFKFDISGVTRTQVEDIIIYVNRTSQNAGQILKVDNILLDTVSAGVPGTKDIDLFESSDISTWTHPDWMPYGTVVTWVSPGAVASTGALEIQQNTAAATANALARKYNSVHQDWTDYTTLEFDAKIVAGLAAPSNNGFSVMVYNAGTGGVLRAFKPSTTNFQTFQIDISGMYRDQVDKLLFYVNRTSQGLAQKLVVDNIKLTNNTVLTPPSLVIIDDFDGSISTTIAPTWDYTQASASKAVVTDSYSAPNAFQISLINSSSAAYARGVFNYKVPGSTEDTQEPTQDWQPYKSLIFEAKIITEQPVRPPLSAGYVMNVVNGGKPDLTSIVNDSALKFYPSTEWATYQLDISRMTREQITGLRIYINRSDKWFNLTSGQKLIIDNIRVSMEAAPAPPPTPELVDDFENGMDTWWRYSTHTNSLPGTAGSLFTPGNGGGSCLKITESDANSTSAYLRKTMMADWSGYKSLVFDAMALDSLTQEGFKATVRNYTGYQTGHMFAPSTSWNTFTVDLTGDTRDEVTGLLYYINTTAQNNGQQLFVDNIRLSTQPAETVVGTIGEARNMKDYTEVQIPAKVVTGYFVQLAQDQFVASTLRDVFFIEDDDRSSAIPVVVGPRITTASPVVNVGDRVTVTGFLATGSGQRYIYARSFSVSNTGEDLPKPVCLTHKVAAGESADGGFGLDNTGMLVTLVGKTTMGSYGLGGRPYVYLDDGSGVMSENGAKGIKVYVSPTEWINSDIYIRVTGYLVNELDPATGKVIRALWARSYDYAEIPQ